MTTVEESSAYLTEKEEVDEEDEEALNEAEESLNKYLERRSTLETLSVDTLIETIIFLEDRVRMLEKQISDKDTPS